MMAPTFVCHTLANADGSITAVVGGGGGQVCNEIWISKVGAAIQTNHDAIWDGQIGIPVIADQIVVAMCGTHYELDGYKDVVYLYGIKRNGGVTCAFPIQEYAKNRREAVYLGANRVIIKDPDLNDPGRMYCWDGVDWTQSNNNHMCDPNHTCRLVSLRNAGGVNVWRQEYGPPLVNTGEDPAA